MILGRYFVITTPVADANSEGVADIHDPVPESVPIPRYA